MNSLEKIHAFRTELEGAPGPDADPLELGMRTIVAIGAPMLNQILPDDPAIMDEALAQIAAKLLELRSDEAPQLAVAPARAGLLEGSG